MDIASSWQHVTRTCALAFGLGALASTIANPAMAGCGLYNPAARLTPSATVGQEGAGLIDAAYRAGSGPFLPVADGRGRSDNGIAGMWAVTFVSDGVAPNPVPAGVVTDFGTVQWHDDGTEIMISGGRPPSTGDVCMGVWEQIGPFTYKLKHIALAWISPDTPSSMGGPGPSPAQFLGQAVISEVVTLDNRRASYKGHFTLDQYNADQTMVLVHLSGTITGTRVTVN